MAGLNSTFDNLENSLTRVEDLLRQLIRIKFGKEWEEIKDTSIEELDAEWKSKSHSDLDSQSECITKGDVSSIASISVNIAYSASMPIAEEKNHHLCSSILSTSAPVAMAMATEDDEQEVLPDATMQESTSLVTVSDLEGEEVMQVSEGDEFSASEMQHEFTGVAGEINRGTQVVSPIEFVKAVIIKASAESEVFQEDTNEVHNSKKYLSVLRPVFPSFSKELSKESNLDDSANLWYDDLAMFEHNIDLKKEINEEINTISNLIFDPGSAINLFVHFTSLKFTQHKDLQVTTTTDVFLTCLMKCCNYKRKPIIVLHACEGKWHCYELFYGIILICDGQKLYQRPCEYVLDFFEAMGIKCPERKAVADFLQAVTSRKNKEQYRVCRDEMYYVVMMTQFAVAFHVGKRKGNKLDALFDMSKNYPTALIRKYGVDREELLKVNFSREFLLMKRNSLVYNFQLFQLATMAFITMTVFLQTEMYHKSEKQGGVTNYRVSFLTNYKVLGLPQGDIAPMDPILKIEKAPLQSYADINGLNAEFCVSNFMEYD